jgi:hypothetical protein
MFQSARARNPNEASPSTPIGIPFTPSSINAHTSVPKPIDIVYAAAHGHIHERIR